MVKGQHCRRWRGCSYIADRFQAAVLLPIDLYIDRFSPFGRNRIRATFAVQYQSYQELGVAQILLGNRWYESLTARVKLSSKIL